MTSGPGEGRAWAEALCVVDFDITEGHVVRHVVPEALAASLSEPERAQIANLALPDSAGGGGSSVPGPPGDRGGNAEFFSFRVRRGSGPAGVSNGGGDVFLNAHCMFRSIRDPTQKRGFSQSAVVLLTQLTLVKLFDSAIRTIGPAYFEFGPAILEPAYLQMRGWPMLGTGELTWKVLPLVGSTLRCRLPFLEEGDTEDAEGPSLVEASKQINTSHINQHRGLYSCFGPIVEDLWHLWALILCGESLLVLGPSAEVVSNCVHALVPPRPCLSMSLKTNEKYPSSHPPTHLSIF